MLRVVEINDVERLREFHLAWRLLLPQTPNASFFQSLDWLECYWDHFGEGQHLRVLFVCNGNTPIGIVPLVVRTESLRVGRYRVLTYPLHDWATFYGPIGPNPTATLTAALQHIRSSPRDWDIVDLRWVDREGADDGRTASALRFTGFDHVERVWKRTAVIDLKDGWDAYFGSLPSKHRSELRRLDRRLEEKGELQLERYRPDLHQIEAEGECPWFEQCYSIARLSWQGASRDGTTLCHPEVAPFFRNSHLLASKAGAVDIALLRLNQQAIAFAYNLHCQGRVFGLRTGYDPRYAKHAPGVVLWKRMLEDSCRRGDVFVDLGPDSPHIKKRWATGFAPSMHYRHYASGARNALLRVKDWFVDQRSGRTENTPVTAE